MKYNLHELHKLAAYASIIQIKFSSGYFTSEQFIKEVEDLNVHAHEDIKLYAHHSHLEADYREIIEGILRLYDQEKKK